MLTQFMHKKKLGLILLFIIAITTVLITFLNPNKSTDHVQLGDQVAIFSKINAAGKEDRSVLAIYNSDFTKEKMIINLDDIFYSVDQINSSADMASEVSSNKILFRVYNDKEYQDVSLDLKDGSVEKSKVVNKTYNGDEKMKMNLYSNGDFELTKPDSYMVIEDPELYIESDYYSMSDYTQLTNYN